MNILYELGISGKGNLIFVPSWMPEMRFESLSTIGMLSMRDFAKKLKELAEQLEKTGTTCKEKQYSSKDSAG